MDADIKIIYQHLHSRYPIVLSSSFSMGFRCDIDYPVLCGKSVLGKFELFCDDLPSFAFYAMHDNGEVFAHCHFRTVSQAMQAVVDFMEGKIIWIQFG